MVKVAVLGAGHGGFAWAANLSLGGHEVNLYELHQFKEKLEPIIERENTIYITGETVGISFPYTEFKPAKLTNVTTDIKEAVEGTEFIAVVVVANAHPIFNDLLIPYLEDGQVVVYFGKGGAALQMANMMKERGVRKDVLLADTNTLGMASRRGPYVYPPSPAKRPREVPIEAHQVLAWYRGTVNVSAFPEKKTEQVVDFLKEVCKTYPFPEENLPIVGSSILETLLNDWNALTHQSSFMPNWAYIERAKGENLRLFKPPLFTRSAARLMEAIDKERNNLKKAFGISIYPSFMEEVCKSTGVDSTIQDAAYEAWLKYPISGPIVCGKAALQMRYVTEDVPYGLVTWASLGDQFGVPAPVCKAIVTLASVYNKTDYWKEGRTVDKLGLAEIKTVKELRKFLKEGEL